VIPAQASRARQWMSRLALRPPAVLRSLRKTPVLGEFVHWVSYRLLPAGEKIWAKIEAGPLQGVWIEINPRTGQAYVQGDAEVAVQNAIAQRLAPGMTFYDLGANIGLFSLLAARIVGGEGRVISFEPDPRSAARLRRNVEHNGFSQVIIVEAGVWSQTGFVGFAAADPSSPDRGTGKIVEDSGAPDTRIPCIALDDFIKTAPPPDGVKCDVEGAEVEALRGARNLIQEFRPWILCEIHSEANGVAFCDFLGGFGYRFEPVDANHVLASV
jgi:FkbM family methyltransferase